MTSMLSMSSGLMSFNRPATADACDPRPPLPPGPVAVALETRTPST
jgi:hypothetical protein